MFAAGIIALHRGMLQYYVQMRYLTPVEAERCRTGAMPLFAPLPRPGASAVRESSADADASIGDPVAALRGAFARNLYNALVARAQSELLETVARHPDGRTLAVEVPERTPHHAHRECTTTAIVQRRRKRFAIRDEALAAMLQSLDEEPMPRPRRGAHRLRQRPVIDHAADQMRAIADHLLNSAEGRNGLDLSP